MQINCFSSFLLFIGEIYLCKPTHTHTILVSLGHLLKGRRQIAVAEL